MAREYTKPILLGDMKVSRGQRFCYAKGTDDPYLFDWSGSHPGATDDGPLRIILTEPIEYDEGSRYWYVGVVQESIKERRVVGMSMREAIHLSKLISLPLSACDFQLEVTHG